MNRRFTSEKHNLDFYIKPLSDEAAFNKGVDYFVDIVFFYGALFGLALFELERNVKNSAKAKQEFNEVKDWTTFN